MADFDDFYAATYEFLMASAPLDPSEMRECCNHRQTPGPSAVMGSSNHNIGR